MKKVHRTSSQRRQDKVRAKIKGTAEKPRVSVYKSNRYIYVQAINDLEAKTVAAASSKLKDAETVGEKLGEMLKKKKIELAVFDRGSYRYHGNVKELADAVRKSGVKF